MNDLQIDYFMAVGTNLSFTKTSQELYVSQPAISKQIKLMEEELGVKLFYRNNKRTELTEAGKLFYEFFGNYKAERKNVTQKAILMQDRERRSLKVGFLEGWDLTMILPQFNRRLREVFPEIEIDIDCAGVKELAASVLSGRLDLAMSLHNSLYDLQDFSCNDIGKVRKVLMYSSRSKYAEIEEPAVGDFKDALFVAPTCIDDNVVARIVQSYCKPFGFTPEIKFVHNFEAMITYVRNDMGVAFADSWNWAINSPDIKHMDLDMSDDMSIVTVSREARPTIATAADILETVTTDAFSSSTWFFSEDNQ